MDEEPPSDAVSAQLTKFGRLYQNLLDTVTPHLIFRWVATCIIFLLYVLRVYYLAGFYIISYALGIYLLNLLIGFLSPQIDPGFFFSINRLS